eukprot:3644666-Amphidinium_carterae.1
MVICQAVWGRIVCNGGKHWPGGSEHGVLLDVCAGVGRWSHSPVWTGGVTGHALHSGGWQLSCKYNQGKSCMAANTYALMHNIEWQPWTSGGGICDVHQTS